MASFNDETLNCHLKEIQKSLVDLPLRASRKLTADEWSSIGQRPDEKVDLGIQLLVDRLHQVL